MPGPSGQTSRLQLPYPVPDDSVDVPRDVKALADKLDPLAATVIPVVGALPANPIDGQEVFYKFTAYGQNGNATASLLYTGIWRCRYDAAAGPAWYVIGGTPLFLRRDEEVWKSQTVAGWSNWGAMYAASDNQIRPFGLTLPVRGDYLVEIGAVRVTHDQVADWSASFCVSPAEGNPDVAEIPQAGSSAISVRSMWGYGTAVQGGPSVASVITNATGALKWVVSNSYGITRIYARTMKVTPLFLKP